MSITCLNTLLSAVHACSSASVEFLKKVLLQWRPRRRQWPLPHVLSHVLRGCCVGAWRHGVRLKTPNTIGAHSACCRPGISLQHHHPYRLQAPLLWTRDVRTKRCVALCGGATTVRFMILQGFDLHTPRAPAGAAPPRPHPLAAFDRCDALRVLALKAGPLPRTRSDGFDQHQIQRLVLTQSGACPSIKAARLDMRFVAVTQLPAVPHRTARRTPLTHALGFWRPPNSAAWLQAVKYGSVGSLWQACTVLP